MGTLTHVKNLIIHSLKLGRKSRIVITRQLMLLLSHSKINLYSSMVANKRHPVIYVINQNAIILLMISGYQSTLKLINLLIQIMYPQILIWLMVSKKMIQKYSFLVGTHKPKTSLEPSHLYSISFMMMLYRLKRLRLLILENIRLLIKELFGIKMPFINPLCIAYK